METTGSEAKKVCSFVSGKKEDLCDAEPQADGPPVRFQLFYASEFHYRGTYVLQAFVAEIRARNVLDVGAEVDAGVLLGVAKGCCQCVSIVC